MRIGPEPMMRTFIDLAPRGRGPWARSDRSSRRSRSSLGSCSSYVEPPPADENAATADANRGDRWSSPIDFYLEDARAAHLEALLDPDACRWLDPHQLVSHEERAQGTLGRAGRRIFADPERLGEHSPVHV